MEKTTRKPRTHCRGIQEQFVEKILSGEKTTTIRPAAKDMQAGDKIKFFTGWRKKGALYRVTVEIARIDYILITAEDINLVVLPDYEFTFPSPEEIELIALSDGFKSFAEMQNWFQNKYPQKNPRKGPWDSEWYFEGTLITFSNPRIEAK